MTITSSLYQQYGFSTVIADGIEVIYSYATIDPVVSYIDISYTYSDSNDDNDYKDLVYGNKAAFTQQILNNLPPWMSMRQNYNSVGNLLTNAWGMNLERILDTYSTLRKDEFLSTADTYYNINLAVSDLVSSNSRIYTPILNNFLYNSSFSMKAPARANKPLGWRVSHNDSRAFSFCTTCSIFGTNSIMLNGSYSSVQLEQTRDRALAPSPVTYSIFVKCDTGLSTTDTWDANEAGLIMSVLHADSTVTTYGVGFPKNTSGKWARVSLTANLLKDSSKITAIILNRKPYSFIVDCPLLEQSKTLNSWSPSYEDVPITSSSDTRLVAGVQVLFKSNEGTNVSKIEVFPTASEEEFKNLLVPTRIEPYVLVRDSANAFSSTYGRHINYFEEVLPTSWKAIDGYIQEKSTDFPDILSNRKPADLILKEDGNIVLDASLINDNATQVKAVCVVDNILYCVTKETYQDISRYYLKFVAPSVVNYSDNYMPSLGDIQLPIVLGTSYGIDALSEDVNRIGICKNNPGVIFIDTSLDRRFYFKLYFDYYFPNFTNRRIFCRENYSKDNGILQVI